MGEEQKVVLPLISVIVPVYNVESSLPKCLESIIEQTYRNLEIILVDDGSTDNSLAILRIFALKDKRIKVVSKDNGGASSARNVGISMANGEYLAFIDADDYVDVNYLQELVQAANKADIPVCAWQDLYLPQGKLVKNILSKEKLTQLKNNIKYDFYILNHHFRYPYLKLYKRSVILNNKLRFPEEFPDAEDQAFNFAYYDFVKSYAFVNKPLYSYVHWGRASLSKVTTRRSYRANLKKLELERQFLQRQAVLMRERILTDSALWILRKYVQIDNEKNDLDSFRERYEQLRPYMDLSVTGNNFRQSVLLLLLKYDLLAVVYFYYCLLKGAERRKHTPCTPPPKLTYPIRRMVSVA